ncbi:MAG: MFS transporter [Actinomycetota bacterium]|nr:MFS transporter [Actinomycetota bacterium]
MASRVAQTTPGGVAGRSAPRGSRRGPGLRFAIVSAGVLTIGVTYGLARYGFGLFVPELRQAFRLDAAAIGLLATGAYATYLAATALTARAAPRLGLRRPVVAAGALAAGGMLMIAVSTSPIALALGVLAAGASSGIAYPPFSEAVKRLLSGPQRATAIALINSGTSYGVLVSGPLALAAGDAWRLAWLSFALLAVAVTVWSRFVLPRDFGAVRGRPGNGAAPTALVSRRSAGLFAASLTIGFGTSVYWTFAVDLVASAETLPSGAGRVLVVIIGVAGIAGGSTGSAMRWFGPRATFCASTGALAGALVLLALGPGAWATLAISGALFGAAYFTATGYLGIWSLQVFDERPAAGFGATYFLISVGQLVGPLPAGLLASGVGLESAFYLGAALTLSTWLFIGRRGNEAGDASGARTIGCPVPRRSPERTAGALSARRGHRGSRSGRATRLAGSRTSAVAASLAVWFSRRGSQGRRPHGPRDDPRDEWRPP